eukprot:479769-Hanusia_phi.AAC.1
MRRGGRSSRKQLATSPQLRASTAHGARASACGAVRAACGRRRAARRKRRGTRRRRRCYASRTSRRPWTSLGG